MRRKDREVTDETQIDGIIGSCDCCRLGLADGPEVYIVPLNFAYIRKGNRQVFYFHGACQGRKIDLIRKNGRAGFELDTAHALDASGTACSFSFRYGSVIGRGTIAIVEERKEKETALGLIMEHYTGQRDWTFEETGLDSVAVIKLTVEQISCKVHL